MTVSAPMNPSGLGWADGWSGEGNSIWRTSSQAQLLLAVMRMRESLEVLRIGLVQEAPVEPGRPPAFAPPESQFAACIKHDHVELHAAHQEPGCVAHDRVLGCEARRNVDGDRAPGWAADDEVREWRPVEGCRRGRVDGLLVQHKLEEDERERSMRSRSPNEAVISLSPSWPTQRKCFSARSRLIYSQVWRMAAGQIIR